MSAPDIPVPEQATEARTQTTGQVSGETIAEATPETTAETAETALAPALNSKDWQRLSPIAIIHFIIKFALDLVKNGVQNVAILGGVVVATGDGRWMVLSLIGIAVTVLLLGGGVLSYLNFRFRVDRGAFLIRKGVIQKKRLTLSFDRIQNIAIGQPFYFIPFGLVSLGLESAGSSDEEVKLAGIPEVLARDIRAYVLADKRDTAKAPGGIETKAAGGSAPEESTPEETAPKETASEESTPELLLAQPVSELVRYGLSNNNIWVVAGVSIGLLFQQFEQWEGAAASLLTDSILDAVRDDYTLIGMAGAALLLGLVLLLMSFSVVGAIVVFFRFRLSHEKDRYIRTKGLFERQETSVRESKVQSLQIGQPWPALLLRRCHLALRQVGFSDKNNSGSLPQQPKFIIPSVTDDFIADFTGRLFPGLAWHAVRFRQIHPLYTIKMLSYNFLPPAIIAAAAITYEYGSAGLLALLAPVVAAPFVMLRRRRYGYWSDGACGVVRRGFVGSRRTVFPFYKAQGVVLTQAPSQRKYGLADLKVMLAGGDVTIPFMPLADAEAWRDRILYEVEASTRPWM
jgi:putative membrane protein